MTGTPHAVDHGVDRELSAATRADAFHGDPGVRPERVWWVPVPRRGGPPGRRRCQAARRDGFHDGWSTVVDQLVDHLQSS